MGIRDVWGLLDQEADETRGFLKGEIWGLGRQDRGKGAWRWLRLGLSWGCSGRTSEGIHVGKEELLEC